jgi:seryl-tRNA synthetase|eukprot:CAMPEP_0174292478 /NCGR_PEP_ID=MMETSP0809-20121228/35601_1 /TAXON_ID=73025 ORGANISM="Eutreptiella gymnastica-like, Strain CCMP1594" /NCGR_SAMPLE_ID=MMETSP0809 /ASSEMBLY_ACC=CAM_ASM_000658 /LENGTH=464 /DNA_ID=CAMNT_0015392577 /DNA_START=43 /DNA_END=1437 /DNA_ORIENTATION=-
MLDILLFRQDKGGNPDLVRESQRRRCKDVGVVDKVIELDNEWRKLTGKVDNLRKNAGLCSKAVGEKKKKKEPDGEDLPIPEDLLKSLDNLDKEALTQLSVLQLKTLSKKCAEEVEVATKQCEEKEAERDQVLGSIGNIVHEDCLPTTDEDENQVVRTWGECKPAEGKLNHVDLMAKLGLDTSETATRTAGGRAFFLQGPLCQLQLGLINYAMNFLIAREYTPMYPPFFMTKEAMGAVAQLSDFDDQLYKVSGEGDDKYLIATSEQPIAAYHRNKWFAEKDLPIKYAGYSTCFRKEVGSHGRDTLGIFRVHQFDKIEQFCVTTPKDGKSWEMMESMITTSEDFYQSLEIPYRVVRIVAGALNDAAAMKYDLEGFYCASQKYRELVSCSNCTDFQSRRVGARIGSGKKEGQANVKEHVHMLNSTLCAITRVMCCICETHQCAEGIQIPKNLQPYMGGMELMKWVTP